MSLPVGACFRFPWWVTSIFSWFPHLTVCWTAHSCLYNSFPLLSPFSLSFFSFLLLASPSGSPPRWFRSVTLSSMFLPWSSRSTFLCFSLSILLRYSSSSFVFNISLSCCLSFDLFISVPFWFILIHHILSFRLCFLIYFCHCWSICCILTHFRNISGTRRRHHLVFPR